MLGQMLWSAIPEYPDSNMATVNRYIRWEQFFGHFGLVWGFSRLVFALALRWYSASFMGVVQSKGKSGRVFNLPGCLCSRSAQRSFVPPLSFLLWVVGIVSALNSRRPGLRAFRSDVDARRYSSSRGEGVAIHDDIIMPGKSWHILEYLLSNERVFIQEPSTNSQPPPTQFR
jgi:hypothetical protein